MKRKSQGVVLISVLMFMLILAMIGIYGLEMSLVEMKVAHSMWRRHVLYNSSESALSKVEADVFYSSPRCLIPITESNRILMQPIKWWQTVACQGDDAEFLYYYVVENLGTDPCAIVNTRVYSKKIAASYFRVTLLGLSGGIKTVLQSTIIKPDEMSDVTVCYGKERFVNIGRQMWRELIMIL